MLPCGEGGRVRVSGEGKTDEGREVENNECD